MLCDVRQIEAKARHQKVLALSFSLSLSLSLSLSVFLTGLACPSITQSMDHALGRRHARIVQPDLPQSTTVVSAAFCHLPSCSGDHCSAPAPGCN
ncbi:hypothetical protein BKA81DRAFT_368554, partial [Phyllosticta paracitricarpa]